MEKPSKSSKRFRGPMLVCAAVIFDRGRYLIAQRLPTARNEAGKWEFPGGKVEAGESPEEALAREIEEELALKVRVEDLLLASSHIYEVTSAGALGEKEFLHIVLLSYWCSLVGSASEIKTLEVADAKWISLDQVGDFPFASADGPLIDKLKKLIRR